jgi:hypothetical protein
VPGGSITLDVSIEATPHIHMQLGGQNGNFLIDTGASTSSVDARIFGVTVGSSIRIEGSTFPTSVFDWLARRSTAIAPTIRMRRK